jgi:sugar lactone lactonase YvrE
MNSLKHVLRSARLPSTLLLTLFACAGAYGQAPQFAFSIGSGQIPGAIIPTALGTDSASNIYVCTLSAVVKLARNGSFLARWGSQGTGPGQFTYPGPIAFDAAHNIYVVDSYNDRVEKLDAAGNFIQAWGTNGVAPGQFDYPEGLAVDGTGQVYVSDSMNSRIEVFDSSGTFVNSFGSIGTNAGEFFFSGPIAIDSSNNIYVIDVPGRPYDNYRVQKFDANGSFITQWPSHGPGPDPSVGIQVPAIVTDSSNNVFIVDGSNNKIQEYSSEGVFVTEWGSLGTGPGQFNGPMGIAIDPSGNYIYVSDYYNARINVFAYAPLDPIIYNSPTNQTVAAGTTLSLAVGAFGAQSLAYRWNKDGADISGATDAALSIPGVPLAASGTYFVTVTNALGVAVSSNATITVLPAVVTTLPASAISATGAVLNGSVVLGGNPSAAWFEWGTDANYGNIAGLTNLNANTNANLHQPLGGLSGAITYHFRLAASNTLGIVYGGDAVFQPGLKPSLAQLTVAATGASSVLLRASVNPNGRPTSVYFRWGTGNPTHYTPTNQIGNGAAAVAVQNEITGLVAATYYNFQAVASNELGVVSGPLMNFVAPSWTVLPVPSGINWKSVATSADGHKVAALGNDAKIYVSSDFGLTWTSNVSPSAPWQAITISADGTRLVAAAGSGTSPLQTGPAFFSTNGGATWTAASVPLRTWYSLASSGDGLKVAGVDLFGERVLTSTNGGQNWATNSPPMAAPWSAIASSADGNRLIVAAGGGSGITNGPVFTSIDAGASWISNNLPIQYWQCVASSAAGQSLVAAVGGRHAGPIYISTNFGTSWTASSAPVTNWQSVAISADGKKLAAIEHADSKAVYISTDSGLTWQAEQLPQATWSTIVGSADGARLYAISDQNLLTQQTAPAPELAPRLLSSPARVSLSWIIPSMPFHLQQANALLLPPQWIDLTNPPSFVPTSLRYELSLPTTNSVGIFRLIGP